MAYYMTVETKKGEYLPLDITSLDGVYQRKSRYKNGGSTIEEIDLFTMNFTNEQSLRYTLLTSGILPPEYGTKPLSARQIIKNHYSEKLMYDFLYKKDKVYINNPRKLIAEINERLAAEDFLFISRLASTFMDFHDCKSTGPEVVMATNDSILQGRRSKYFDREINRDGDNLLVRMLKLLIYEYKQAPNGKTYYTNIVKHNNLRAIIAFMNYYDQEMEKKTEKDKPKTRKRTKPTKIENQTSLFDEK